ncbi:MAG: hypothetical protein IKL10_01510 [Clostridia bacterium]|nr:hypothetical protein [Clostridia bacterium]
MQNIISFFISIAVFFFNLTASNVPEAKSQDNFTELSDIFEEYTIGETVYILNSSTFTSQNDRFTAIALQGLVAKVSPQIFVTSSSLDETYIKAIEETGTEISRSDENGNLWTLETLITKFKSYIKDGGYILYCADESNKGLNIATNYATLNGWLPVPEELEDMAINAGLTMKKDISEDKYSAYYQWKFFEKNKQNFSKAAVIHQSQEITGLRDLAIQQGFYVFFTDDDIISELLFRRRVLNYFGDNTHILGWVKYEVAFVDSASKAGNMISPSDHSHNNSILASITCDIPEQKTTKNTYTDETKHYTALVMSDGDNMQWIQNGYSEYFGKLALEDNFPMTWSFPPILQDFSPVTAKTMYEAASDRDYFMAGVSGAGYMHPTQYPRKALIEFTDKTAAAMAKSDMEYVQILDDTPENELDEVKLINSLKYYTRYDNIKGGIISLDPARYAGGEGRIYFVDDKPFLTYRLSLWHPTGEKQNVTTEWLDEQADIVNSYPSDVHSINGYSVINIHPWSISTESLSYFASQLDDDVVLITLEELMDMINANIPHENAKISIEQ